MDTMKYLTDELANLDTRGWISIAVAIVSVVVASAGILMARERLRSRAIEKAMTKQGIPIAAGRTFVEGHAGIMREMNMAGLELPQDPEDPHNHYPRTLAFQYENSKIYGSSFLYWRGSEVTLHTQDPAILKEIMVTKFSDFEKSYLQVKHLEDLVGKCGITTAGGQSWAHQRKIVNPAFHLEKLKQLVPAMVQSTDEFMGSWVKAVDDAGGSSEMEISPTIAQITADVISRTAFGSTYEKGKLFFGKQLEIVRHTGMKGLTVTIPGLDILPTAYNRKIWKLQKEIKQMIDDIVLQARREKVKLGDKVSFGNNLLGIMLAASEELEPSKRLTNEELLDEVKTFFFGGQDTTAVLLVWVLMLLASHQDWQEKAYNEIRSVCEDKPLDFDLLNKLKTVGNILNETLRLYPPAAWMQRQAQRDVQVGDLFFPKGLTILMNLTAMHTDVKQWGEDATQFRPDRFANGISSAAKHPLAFAPFNVGPRNCVGQIFALMEAKVVLVSILRAFHFSLSPKYQHHPTILLTIKPKYGLPLVLSKRP